MTTPQKGGAAIAGRTMPAASLKDGETMDDVLHMWDYMREKGYATLDLA